MLPSAYLLKLEGKDRNDASVHYPALVIIAKGPFGSP